MRALSEISFLPDQCGADSLVAVWAWRIPEGYRPILLSLFGEIVVLDKDGVSDFDALHSRKHDKRAMFYAFDMLAGDGEDYRTLALLLRKANLARLLKRRVDGIFIAEYEQGEIGDVLFRVACNIGLEGIVSKRLDRAYGAGRCKHWIKIKSPAHPAYSRVRDFHQSLRSCRLA